VAEPDIFGKIDDTHPATTELVENPVVGDGFALHTARSLRGGRNVPQTVGQRGMAVNAGCGYSR